MRLFVSHGPTGNLHIISTQQRRIHRHVHPHGVPIRARIRTGHVDDGVAVCEGDACNKWDYELDWTERARERSEESGEAGERGRKGVGTYRPCSRR